MKKRAIQFKKCITKVYRFKQFVTNLSEGRTNPSIPLSDAILVLFLGIVTQMGSLNQIEEKLRQGYFNKALGKKVIKGSAETLGNVLQVVLVKEFIQFCRNIIKTACYNGALKGGTIDGFTVVALDGTELTRTESKQRSCSCCKTTVHTKEDGSKVVQPGGYIHRSQAGIPSPATSAHY